MAFATSFISLGAASLIPIACSIAIVVYLLRCLIDVVRGWNDPAARVLRFSSIGLLLLIAVASIALALSPALFESSDEEPTETESTEPAPI